jgi:uncharacterized RDD family membrane protein YckC
MHPGNGPTLRAYLKTSGSPWLRWGARIFDNITVGVVIGAATSKWLQDIPPELARLQAIPILLLWVPLEAILISRFAATPGKWLFGIAVFHQDGSHLTFRTALQRSGAVFLKGMGAGLFAPLAQVWSFWRIANGGQTSWDREYSSVIVWQRCYLRACLGALLLLAQVYFVTSLAQVYFTSTIWRTQG